MRARSYRIKVAYPPSANRFFLNFAELEFALVEKGVAKINREDFLINPHWDGLFGRLSADHRDAITQFIQDHRDIVIADPPRQMRYIRADQEFDWVLPAAEDISAEAFNGLEQKEQFDRITRCLRRVRNNLFHGSKFRDPSEWTNNRLDQCFPIIEGLSVLVARIAWGEPTRQNR